MATIFGGKYYTRHTHKHTPCVNICCFGGRCFGSVYHREPSQFKVRSIKYITRTRYSWCRAVSLHFHVSHSHWETQPPCSECTERERDRRAFSNCGLQTLTHRNSLSSGSHIRTLAYITFPPSVVAFTLD